MEDQAPRPPRSPSSPALAAILDRCVKALGQAPERLKVELVAMFGLDAPDARFARALLQLELARLGDSQAKESMRETADLLLEFWNDRSGDELAEIHPALTTLWTQAAHLLQRFEARKFQRALAACWDAKADPTMLAEAIGQLAPAGNRRVEFAACLYHLELARLGVATSRAEFARRAALVQEAYLSPEIAQGLVGDDAGLSALWKDLIPYLDEFFENLEAEAERRQAAEAEPAPEDDGSADTSERSRHEPTTAPGAPAAEASVITAPDVEAVSRAAQTQPNPALEPTVVVDDNLTGEQPALLVVPGLEQELEAVEVVSAEEEAAAFDDTAPKLKGAPALEDTTLPGRPAVDALTPREPQPAVGKNLFDAWLNPEPARRRPPTEPDLDAVEVVEALPSAAPPPRPPDATPFPGPPPPPNTTPAPGSLKALPRPPPPPNTTPAPGSLKALPPRPSAKPRPRPPPPPSLDIAAESYTPDAQALAFWRHTEVALGLLPSPDSPRLDRRALSAEGRAERKKLNGWIDGLGQKYDAVPESRALACLLKLYMAAQVKEKTLFGQPNPKRKEAFLDAFALLSGEALAAGHAAVWFELDGPETVKHLQAGLEQLQDYLQFCARGTLDPTSPEAAAQFLGL